MIAHNYMKHHTLPSVIYNMRPEEQVFMQAIYEVELERKQEMIEQMQESDGPMCPMWLTT